jgi:hypothetical protein
MRNHLPALRANTAPGRPDAKVAKTIQGGIDTGDDARMRRQMRRIAGERASVVMLQFSDRRTRDHVFELRFCVMEMSATGLAYRGDSIRVNASGRSGGQLSFSGHSPALVLAQSDSRSLTLWRSPGVQRGHVYGGLASPGRCSACGEFGTRSYGCQVRSRPAWAGAPRRGRGGPRRRSPLCAGPFLRRRCSRRSQRRRTAGSAGWRWPWRCRPTPSRL